MQREDCMQQFEKALQVDTQKMELMVEAMAYFQVYTNASIPHLSVLKQTFGETICTCVRILEAIAIATRADCLENGDVIDYLRVSYTAHKVKSGLSLAWPERFTNETAKWQSTARSYFYECF